MDIFYLMEIAIIIISMLTIFLEIKVIIKFGFNLLTAAVVFVALFWTVYYGYQLVHEMLGFSLPTYEIYVRSGILLSMTVFAAKAIRVARKTK